MITGHPAIDLSPFRSLHCEPQAAHPCLSRKTVRVDYVLILGGIHSTVEALPAPALDPDVLFPQVVNVMCAFEAICGRVNRTSALSIVLRVQETVSTSFCLKLTRYHDIIHVARHAGIRPCRPSEHTKRAVGGATISTLGTSYMARDANE